MEIAMTTNMIIDRVYDEIHSWITSGRLETGMRLPSERKLATEFNVSRASVREALTRLADGGFLRSNSPRIRVAVNPGNKRYRLNDLLTNTICVLGNSLIRPVSDTESGWADRVLLGCLEEIEAHQYNVMIIQRSSWGQSIRSFSNDRPLGVVVPEVLEDSHDSSRLLSRLHKVDVPTVFYGDAGIVGADQVISDHERGAYDLTKWLIRQGRRRIAHLWSIPYDLLWIRQRQKGYERAMMEAGLPIPRQITTPHHPGQFKDSSELKTFARTCAGHLVESFMGSAPIDAIMLPTDRMIHPIAAACRIFGKIPNEDVLIVGYDNYWNGCWEKEIEPAPPAATVDKQNLEIGHAMVKLLIERINGKLPVGPQMKKVLPKLVVIKNR